MARTVVLLPEAAQDVIDAYEWYEARSPGLGSEFLRNLDACFSLIERNPEISSRVYKSFRRTLVRRFPFAVFYEIAPEALVVYSVFHCAQEPGKWKRRSRPS